MEETRRQTIAINPDAYARTGGVAVTFLCQLCEAANVVTQEVGPWARPIEVAAPTTCESCGGQPKAWIVRRVKPAYREEAH